MLQNATLLGVHPSPPAQTGAARNDRCTVCPPTTAEMRWLTQANLSANSTLYLPLPPVGPAISINTGDRLQIRLDGQGATEWTAVDVSEQIGGVIRYTRVFLAPAEA